MDETLAKYAGGLTEGSARNRLPILRDFFGFCGVSACEAIEWQRSHPGDYRFVDLGYEWLKGDDLLVSSKRSKMGVLNGFFMANRVPLPRDRHRFHSEKVPVVGEMFVEEFRKIVIASNPTYQAAFMVQFQSGSGAGELCYINLHHGKHVWREVQRDAKIIRLAMPGRKSKRNVEPYYTFIGFDAVECLKRLLRVMGGKPDSVLFRTERGAPLTRFSLSNYFRKKAMKLGLIEAKTPKCMDCGGETVKQIGRVKRVDGKRPETVFYVCLSCGEKRRAQEYNVSQSEYSGIRYRLRTHEVRDLFRTEWHRAQRVFGVDSDVAEFMMGHSIDSLKYDKIMNDVTATTAEFRKAVPMLNILSEDPRRIERSQIEEELEARDAQVEAMGKELADLRRKIRVLDNPMLLEALEMLKEEGKSKDD